MTGQYDLASEYRRRGREYAESQGRHEDEAIYWRMALTYVSEIAAGDVKRARAAEMGIPALVDEGREAHSHAERGQR